MNMDFETGPCIPCTLGNVDAKYAVDKTAGADNCNEPMGGYDYGCSGDMGMPLARCFCPAQSYGRTLTPMEGLRIGTIFPSLIRPWN